VVWLDGADLPTTGSDGMGWIWGVRDVVAWCDTVTHNNSTNTYHAGYRGYWHVQMVCVSMYSMCQPPDSPQLPDTPDVQIMAWHVVW